MIGLKATSADYGRLFFRRKGKPRNGFATSKENILQEIVPNSFTFKYEVLTPFNVNCATRLQ